MRVAPWQLLGPRAVLTTAPEAGGLSHPSYRRESEDAHPNRTEKHRER